MAKEARELEAFANAMERADLAADAAELARKFDAAGLSKIVTRTPKTELPKDIRTETLRTESLRKEIMEQGGLAEAFKRRGIYVTSDAQYMINRIEFSDKLPELELFWPSGRDLGLRQDSPYSRFTEAGQAAGYSLLRPEVGLYLRLQDTEQPLNNLYWVAMKPLTGRNGYPRVFGLGRYDDGLWLGAGWTHPGDGWDPERRLVFGRSK